MFTEAVVYCVDSVQVAFKTSSEGKHVIQVTGDARQLQGVKTDLKHFVEKIGHKTVKFSISGRHYAKLLV